MFFSESDWDWVSGHSCGQVGQRVEFVWEANFLFSTSSQKKFFTLMPARLQQPSASRQFLVQRDQSFPCCLTGTPSVTLHRLGSSTSIDFSSPSCHSLLDFGKSSMEKRSAAASVQGVGSVGSAPSAAGHSAGALGHTPAWGTEAGYDPRWSHGHQVQPGWAHRLGLFHSTAQTSLFLRCPASEQEREDKVSKSKGPSTGVGRAESTFNNLSAYLNTVPGTPVL